MAFIYDLTDTWNAGGATFNAIKMNVTDTASAAGSKLVTLQVGGAERFSVDKAGIGAFGSAIRAAGGSTSAPAFSFTGDTNTGMWSPSSDAIAFSTAGSERLRVTSSGNVGIGTASPGAKLSVNGDGGASLPSIFAGTAGYVSRTAGTTSFCGLSIISGNASTSALNFGDTDDEDRGAIQYLHNVDGMRFITAANERMRIDSSGNVGIGTSSPNGLLHLASASPTFYIDETDQATDEKKWRWNAASKALSLQTTNDAVSAAANAYQIVRGTGTAIDRHAFFTGASLERMRIDSSGNVGIGTSSVNARLSLGALVSNKVFALYDDGSNQYGMGIAGSQYRMFAATGANICFGNYARGTDTFTETVRIDSSGNVGIGTSSVTPVFGTTVKVYNAGSGGTLEVGGATINARLFGSEGAGVAGVGTTTNTAFNFITNNTERARIDSSGNLLVGTTGLSSGMPSSTGMYVEANQGNIKLRAGGGNTVMQFAHSGGTAVVGSITVTASATAYNTSSDYRLKDIDGPIANSGAYIDALKPVQGSWKADGSRFIGLLAHEVQEVSETTIATGEKDGGEMQAMDYSSPEIIANLIAELQSLRARVAQLEGN